MTSDELREFAAWIRQLNIFCAESVGEKCDAAADEIDRLRIVAKSYRLALTAIGRDDALVCRCGHEPYTDGEECPACTALAALEIKIDA